MRPNAWRLQASFGDRPNGCTVRPIVCYSPFMTGHGPAWGSSAFFSVIVGPVDGEFRFGDHVVAQRTGGRTDRCFEPLVQSRVLSRVSVGSLLQRCAKCCRNGSWRQD